MAPLKKNPALLSSGEPANSSMLNGPGGILEVEAVDDRTGLGDADVEVVERGVEVDVRAVADQAVVGEHLDAGVRGLLEGVGQGRAVDGGDHEDLGALGDHVLDLGDLGRDVVLGVLEVGRVAELGERLHEVVAVRDPAGGGLGRHRDADEATGSGCGGAQGPRRRWRHRCCCRLPGAKQAAAMARAQQSLHRNARSSNSDGGDVPSGAVPASSCLDSVRRRSSRRSRPAVSRRLSDCWRRAVSVPVNDNAAHASPGLAPRQVSCQRSPRNSGNAAGSRLWWRVKSPWRAGSTGRSSAAGRGTRRARSSRR